MVQSRWSDKWIDFALVQTIDNLFHDDADVISLSFLQERESARNVIRKCSYNLIVARGINTEDRSILTLNRIQYRDTVVPFVFP